MVDSSGLLLFRRTPDGIVEVLIGHMGGPFWANQQDHAWSVPKGIHDDAEHDHLAVAIREFEEEMGSPPPDGPNIVLGSVKSGSKTITVFAREGDFDAESAVSNTFRLEWPRGSGKIREFPEIDEAAWKNVAEARSLLTKGQVPFLDRLIDHLDAADSPGNEEPPSPTR
ncbi:MAG: NUDIX domain-containing protein [Acidobacteria bacterium]|nr:NUDIX domain-containing protein [Acidobacteriota bacterium]